jgi:hypothetical protein
MSSEVLHVANLLCVTEHNRFAEAAASNDHPGLNLKLIHDAEKATAQTATDSAELALPTNSMPPAMAHFD